MLVGISIPCIILPTMVYVIESDSHFIRRHANYVTAYRLLTKSRLYTSGIYIPRYINKQQIEQWLQSGVHVSAFAVHAYDAVQEKENLNTQDIIDVLTDYAKRIGWELEDVLDRCPVHVVNRPVDVMSVLYYC